MNSWHSLTSSYSKWATCRGVGRYVHTHSFLSILFKCTVVFGIKTCLLTRCTASYFRWLTQRITIKPLLEVLTMGLKCIAQMIGVFLFLEPKLCWYVDTSPFIHCGHELAIFPIAIQCVSEGEARQVAGTLQAVIDSILHGADYTQILVEVACAPGIIHRRSAHKTATHISVDLVIVLFRVDVTCHTSRVTVTCHTICCI